MFLLNESMEQKKGLIYIKPLKYICNLYCPLPSGSLFGSVISPGLSPPSSPGVKSSSPNSLSPVESPVETSSPSVPPLVENPLRSLLNPYRSWFNNLFLA